jgi:hypothetical protein
MASADIRPELLSKFKLEPISQSMVLAAARATL